MSNQDLLEKRLEILENIVALQENSLEQLHNVLVEQGSELEELRAQNILLARFIKKNSVQEEIIDSRPPHYE